MKPWFVVHRWLGWLLGPVLLLSALTGIVLLWLQPWPPTGQPLPPPALAQAMDRGLAELGARHPDLKLSYIDLPRGTDDVLRIRLLPLGRSGGVEGHWAEVDPANGVVVSVQADTHRLQAWLFDLHHELLLREAGSWVLGAVGLAAIVSLLVALRLWLRVRRWRAPTPGRRWHRRAGIVVGLPLLCTLATGFALSWPEAVRAPLTWASGEPRFVPPVSPPRSQDAPAVSAGRALIAGAASFPGAQPTRLYAERAGFFRLRLRSDEWHPNGLNNAYVRAADGVVQQRVGWRELPLSARYTNVVYPLHIGWLPGSPHKPAAVLTRVLLSVLALTLVWLVISGLPWVSRRRVGRPAAPTPPRSIQELAMKDTLPLLKLQRDIPGEPQTDVPAPERRIAGAPRRDTWNVVEQALGPGRLYCGIWHCEPGHWRIRMQEGEHELLTVLSGRCRVHAQDGSHQEAGPGEALFIPSGFCGSFEVLEPLIKTYAIVSPV